MMMQVHPGKRALFVAAEMTTAACYAGSEVPQYLANALFRAGGAAALLTNRRGARFTAKYRMVASARSHGAGDDEAFRCVVGFSSWLSVFCYSAFVRLNLVRALKLVSHSCQLACHIYVHWEEYGSHSRSWGPANLSGALCQPRPSQWADSGCLIEATVVHYQFNWQHTAAGGSTLHEAYQALLLCAELSALVQTWMVSMACC